MTPDRTDHTDRTTKRHGADGGFGEQQLEEQRTVNANRRWAVGASILSALLVGVVVGGVVSVVGSALVGIGLVIVVTGALAYWIWRSAPTMIVRALGARPSNDEDHPRLHNVVDGLCATLGLPPPTVLVVDSPFPNALSLGRDPRNASLIVTSGLEAALSLVELEGVIAHELVHIKRNDMVRSGIAVALVAPISLISPAGSEMVHALVGRGREFSADQRAVGLIRYPAGLGSALRCMERSVDPSMPWPPGPGRIAGLTRCLWIDPMAGNLRGEASAGDLDDTGVRAAALALL